jgi:IS30 family transposase
MGIRSKARVLVDRRLKRRRLTHEERREMLDRMFAGENVHSVAASFGYWHLSVHRVLRGTGGLRPRHRPRSPLRLSRAERDEMLRLLSEGASLRRIAKALHRQPSTISREVRRNHGRRQYRAYLADDAAFARSLRPKPTKLEAQPRLWAAVERMLQKKYSPQQISATLRTEYPDDPEMRVSHEAIYRSLFIQGRGALRAELARWLRTGRTVRAPRSRRPAADRHGTMLSISKRPPEAEDRAVPGHWEGDLLVGKYQSAIATLVERKTRFVILVALPDGRDAESVRIALTKKILQLPEELRRSLTWDRGVEMAQHARFSVDTNVQVYFCDPHSPWQRGSNENTNGLLRQYFPKGTDLRLFTQQELDGVAAELNDRPRQTLGWKRPSEALAQVLP